MGERVDLLEDARHGGEVGRFDLHQLGHDLLGVAAEVGERRAEIEGRELDQQRIGVCEREVEVDDLILMDAPGRSEHLHHRAVVAVRQHAALRRAGSAGGVDEGERVLQAHGCTARLELLSGASTAALAHLLERDRPERLGGRAVGGVHHDHRVHLRDLLADREDLVELLLVLADHRAGFGVGDHPEALLGGVGLVDRHDDRPGRGRGHVRVGPLGAGVGEDADALALVEVEVDQPEANLLDDLGELSIGDVMPGAVTLVADGDVLGVLSGSARDQGGNRL